jgi:hypothetical protein
MAEVEGRKREVAAGEIDTTSVWDGVSCCVG